MTLWLILSLTEAGKDFLPPPLAMRFGSCARRQCVEIEVMNDAVLEDNEVFNVTLSLAPNTSSNIQLGHITTMDVVIIDMDGECLAFY